MESKDKILGRNVNLRFINENDFHLIEKWLNLPEVHIPFGIGELEFLFKPCSTNVSFIIEKKDGTPIGACHFDIWKALNKADYDIFIGEISEWGKGYGTEATKLCVNYAFDKFNLSYIKLQVFGFNTRAIRCYEKVGFREVRRTKNICLYNDKLYDIIVMVKMRNNEEFAKINWASVDLI